MRVVGSGQGLAGGDGGWLWRWRWRVVVQGGCDCGGWWEGNIVSAPLSHSSPAGWYLSAVHNLTVRFSLDLTDPLTSSRCWAVAASRHTVYYCLLLCTVCFCLLQLIIVNCSLLQAGEYRSLQPTAACLLFSILVWSVCYILQQPTSVYTRLARDLLLSLHSAFRGIECRYTG